MFKETEVGLSRKLKFTSLYLRLAGLGRSVPAAALFACLAGLSGLAAQNIEKVSLPPEKLFFPETSLCLLDVRGKEPFYPFDMNYFRTDLLALLRSEGYLRVKTESEVLEMLSRSRASVPETYDPVSLTRISRLTGCEYVAFLRTIAYTMDRHAGFSVPYLFHRNKVTYSAELDLAVVDGKSGSLQYSKKIFGKSSLGRGLQIYPVTEDPSNFLSFPDKEALARAAMQNLALQTCEALLTGIHKTLGVKYICYWQNEVHIISDKPGLCPICGSRLFKIVR